MMFSRRVALLAVALIIVLAYAMPVQAGIGDNLEDFVEQISDLHPEDTDIGTHAGGGFVEMQDKDGTFDLLTEANTGGAGGSEWISTDAFDSTYNTFDITVGDSPWLSLQDQPSHYRGELASADASLGWFDFPSTTLTGTLTVNVSCYTRNEDGAGDDWLDVWVDYTGSGSGADVGDVGQHLTWSYDTIALGSHSVAEVNALRVYFQYKKAGGGDDVLIDHLRIGVSASAADVFDLDLEVGWITDTDFDETNEELCIFGGTQGSEALRVDYWTGSWTNVITDLVAGWNNHSVSITGVAFEIRFTDTTGDAVEADTWEVEGVLLHTWTPSYTPANDQTPTLDNADDGDNMYAQYREYQMTVFVSDQNGFADIDYLEVGLWDNTQTTEYWRLRYDEDTDTFSEEYDIGTVISINAGSSSATEAGNDIDATFYFTIDWDHADLTDTDMKCYVLDAQSLSATTWYEANFDVETRLDYSVAPSVTSDDAGTVDRGDYDETFLLGGTLIYYTSVDDYPPSAQVDVWVAASEYGTNVGPWSDLTLTSGAFEVTCYADDALGQDTYIVKPVIEAAGSGGTSLYYTTDLTDTYIADIVQVQGYSASDEHDNINDDVTIDVTLWYDHDDSLVTTGTVTINGVSAAHQGSGVWRITENKATVQEITYNTVAISGDTHGLTTVDQNGQSVAVIWDQIIVQTTVADDTRLNINANSEIRVTLWLDFADEYLGSGDTVTLNAVGMTWDSGNSWFDLARTKATVGIWKYYVNSSSEATYGITALDVNSKDVSVIFDRLVVDIQADNENPDNGVQVTFTLTIIFDYDDAACTTYQIKVNRDAVHWFSFTNANKSLFVDTNSDVAYPYTASSVTSESTYGITEYTSNTETVTWSPVGNDAPVNDTTPTCADLDDTDNLYAFIRYYTIIAYVSDAQGFADIDYMELSLYSDDQLTLYWTVRYDEDTNTFTEQYDPSNYIDLDTGASSAVESGVDIDATFKIRINWNHPDFSDADFKAYVLDDEPTSDTDWFQDVGGWDYETRLDYSVGPGVTADDAGTVDRGDLDETFTFAGTIIYYGGTVNPTTALVDVWVAASEYGTNVGPWSDLDLTAGAFSVTCYADDAVGQDTYTVKVVTVGSGAGGTDLYYTTSATDTYIADQITVQTTVADDTRLNINANSEIRVTLWLAYNAEYLGSGDSVTLDDVSMAWDAGNSWFDLTRTKASVGLWKYYVNSSTEATHGVTGLNLNSQEQDVIWDSLTVALSNPTDQRININANASGMIPTITYDYDSSSYDGTFNMNDTDYAHSVVGKYGYKVNSVNGDDTHGITTISSNPDETYCIFDSLTGYITPPDEADQRLNINTNASGMGEWAIYDYDSTDFDGTLGLNDADYAHAVVGNYSYYTASASGDTHGITVFSTYNETWCIFDRLIWTIVPDDLTPDNDVEVTFALSVIFDFDDAACTTYKLTITRDTVHWYTFTDGNKSLFVDTGANLDYDYDVGSIVTESTYDITAEYGLSVTVTWSAPGGDEGEWDAGATGEPEPIPLDIFGLLAIGGGGVLIIALIAFLCMNKKEVYYE